MAASGQESSWWNQPLPAGWEAKYEASQQRYFFLNHANKKTQWEDPRQLHYQQQGSTPSGSSWQQASPYRRSPGPQGEAIALGQLGGRGDWQKQVEDKYNMKVSLMGSQDADAEDEGEDSLQLSDEHRPHQRETTFSHADLQTIKRIKESFPTAQNDVIKDVLGRNQRNEAATIRQLQQMGYQRKQHDSPANAHAMANVAANAHAQHAAANAHARPGNANSPAQQAAANAQHAQTAARLKKDFPTVDEWTVQDVLRAVNFSDSRARQELRALGFKQISMTRSQGPSPASRSSASPQRSSGATSSSKSAGQKSMIRSNIVNEFPKHQKEVIEMALESCGYDQEKTRSLLRVIDADNDTGTADSSSHSVSPQGPSEALKNSIRASIIMDFPDVSRSEIDMALESCHYDDYKTRSKLKLMEDNTLILELNSSPRRSVSPAAAIPSPKLSAAQKNSIKSSLMVEFPDEILLVVEMALDASNYNIDKAREMLKTMRTTRPGHRESSGHKSSGDKARKTSPRKAAGEASRSAGTTSGGHASTSKGKSTATKTTPKPAPRSRQQRSPRRERPAHTTTRTTAYVSANRTQAKGPDSSMARGPDINLLMEEYIPAAGPNASLRIGADPAMHGGPSGQNEGPDSSMAHGPNNSLLAGTDPDLIQGTISCLEETRPHTVCDSIMGALCVRVR